MYLERIAKVNFGIYQKTLNQGDAVYLQAKHIINNKIDDSLTSFTNLKLKDKAKILEKGDILFVAKGDKNFAFCFEEYSMPVIPSSTFITIKIDDKSSILPKYLYYYLNLPNTIRTIKDTATGTGIKNIKKESLEKLKIPIPNFKKQVDLIYMMDLWEEEKNTTESLIEIREKRFNQIFLTAAENI